MSRPACPVDAATVILVRRGRPAGTPWQCYMIRRPVRSDFAADVFVFPGGKLDAPDRREHRGGRTVDHDWLDQLAEGVEQARALRIGAARELFEEIGILLAADDRGLVGGDIQGDARLKDARRDLIAGRLTFPEFLEQYRLTLALDLLHPFSRWITPRELPRRYDTRFYIAFVPHGQEPLLHVAEAPEGVWIAPPEAVRRHEDAEFPLVFATLKHLERMARYRSPEQLIASVSLVDLEPIVPRSAGVAGETRFLLPGEPGYAG